MAVDENRPPYVVFEMRGKEDRDASIKAGHHVEVDIPYAIITRPGSRDTFEQEAEVWLKTLREKGRQNLIPATWFPAFEAAYKSWLSGETAAVSGTPIKGWPNIGAAAQKTLLAAGIQTVEDLANMPDSELQNLGTGAVSFKMKAKAYLEAANGPGKVAEQLTQMQTMLRDLAAKSDSQAAEIVRLRAFEPKETAKAGF